MRATVTTTPQKLVANTSSARDEGARITFDIFSATSTGTVLLERGDTTSTPPSMTNAARWDFSKLALHYECEPGVALWAQVASGTVDLDVLQGGER